MAALKDTPRSGRPPKVTPAYRRALKEALHRGPLAYGYVFTNWNMARLNTHLQCLTGVRICDDWLRQLAHAEGFVYRRIVVVMDQGSPYHAVSLARYLEDVKEHLEVFWLPHYSPELNLIERLGKHLKASRTANVLFASFGTFTRHIPAIPADFALHPDFVLSVTASTRQTATRKNILVAT